MDIPENITKEEVYALKDKFDMVLKFRDEIWYKKGYDEGTKAMLALWESGIL